MKPIDIITKQMHTINDDNLTVLREARDLWGGMFDSKKKEIIAKMKSLGIQETHFIVNKDYTVDTTKDVMIITKKFETCPVEFNVAHGNFIWHYASLTSMKNLPKIVKGNFVISNNKIKSMQDSPTTIVVGQFNCTGNPLKNLKGGPLKTGDYIAMMCGLESLEGSPDEVSGNFLVGSNNLTSLEHSPNVVKGLYDCSNNKLKSLDGITEGLNRIKSDGNLVDLKLIPKSEKSEKKEDNQLHLDFNKWKIKDKVVYHKPGSIFDEIKGMIRDVEDPTAKTPETRYQVWFKKNDNPSIEKDFSILHIKGEHLRKWEEDFEINDQVIYRNSKSKYNGYKGEIVTIETMGEEKSYKVKFDFEYNPGLVNIVSDKNKTAGNIRVKDIKGENLEKINWKDSPFADIIVSDDEKIRVEKDPKNNFIVGEKAYFAGRTVILLNLKTPLIWNVEYEFPSKDEDEIFAVHCDNLTKIKKQDEPVWKILDPIVYLDPNGPYDKCKGLISYVSGNGGVIDIDILDKKGNRVELTNVDHKKLEKDITPKSDKKKKKFKAGDNIIYLSTSENDKNKRLHLCKGKIFCSNVAISPDGRKGTYDVRIIDRDGREETVFWVGPENLKSQEDKFAKGDKIIYNKKDDEYDGKIGTVVDVDKDKYILSLNIDKDLVTISAVDSDNLTKYIKPFEARVHINDEVIYTREDSKYFGCNGIVTSYDVSADKFSVEIKSKDNRVIKIQTKDENLELIPPKKEFKKGDKIRYINSESPHDGLIGQVEEKKANGQYSIKLKNSRGDKIYLTTSADFLILLEESSDVESGEIKYGDYVKYTFPGSKHDGRIGIFQGTREKDGAWIVQFDDDISYLKLYVDPGTLHLTNERPSKKPIATTTHTPPATTTRKKKKKEKPIPRKPVLVYNRRNVAKRAYRPPTTGATETIEDLEPIEFRIGDKIKVTKEGEYKGQIGEITSTWKEHDGTKKYSIRLSTMPYYRYVVGGCSEDEMELVDGDENSSELEDDVKVGDKVIINNSQFVVSGSEGVIERLPISTDIPANRRYEISVSNLSIWLTRDQFKKKKDEKEKIEFSRGDSVKIKNTDIKGKILGKWVVKGVTKYSVKKPNGLVVFGDKPGLVGGLKAEELEKIDDSELEDKKEKEGEFFPGDRVRIKEDGNVGTILDKWPYSGKLRYSVKMPEGGPVIFSTKSRSELSPTGFSADELEKLPYDIEVGDIFVSKSNNNMKLQIMEKHDNDRYLVKYLSDNTENEISGSTIYKWWRKK